MSRRALQGKTKGRRGVGERGVETLEWVGLSALVLTLLLGMFSTMPAGGQAVGAAMHSTISTWVEAWSSAGQLGADLGRGSFSPGDTYPLDVSHDQQFDPYYGGLDPDVLGTSDPYASSATANGRLDAACPDCGPNWWKELAKFSSKLPLSGTPKQTYEGLTSSRYPYVYVKDYRPPSKLGDLWRSVSSSNAWISNGIAATSINLIDYKWGWFNPANKGKPIASTDFASAVTVDTIAGVTAGAVATAVLGPGIAAAIGAAVLLVGIDYAVCKITGKKATDKGKEVVKQLYDGALGLLR